MNFIKVVEIGSYKPFQFYRGCLCLCSLSNRDALPTCCFDDYFTFQGLFTLGLFWVEFFQQVIRLNYNEIYTSVAQLLVVFTILYVFA